MARDLVFEIGVEEIPSAALCDAVSQLQGLAEKRLKSLLLGYEDVRVYGSPRRLVVLVLGLAERQEDLHQRIKGPAAKSAFGPEGRPTPAAIGFARGKGVAVSELVREEEGGKEYVFAVIDREGAASGDVLPDALGSLAAEIQWPKSQRWGSGDARFIRPVRWLLALYGSEVVRVRFAGLTADRLTWGHRFLAKNPISVPDADQYFEALERGKVMVDGATRAEFLREGIDAAAESAGARAVVPEKVFAEVVNLVEYPTVAVGHFDDAFLRVPREVLETAMESHQRYFPLESAEGTLTDGFIVAHNGDPDLTEAIVRGHERVIRARLADAAFFYDEDLKANMEDWVERLETSVFHEKLGTLAAKTERIETLVGVLAEICGAGPDTSAAAIRAAHLAKADLVSHAVVEVPVLQGARGRRRHPRALSSAFRRRRPAGFGGRDAAVGGRQAGHDLRHLRDRPGSHRLCGPLRASPQRHRLPRDDPRRGPRHHPAPRDRGVAGELSRRHVLRAGRCGRRDQRVLQGPGGRAAARSWTGARHHLGGAARQHGERPGRRAGSGHGAHDDAGERRGC
jgi:glycyl-tRNA synthetase beta chain